MEVDDHDVHMGGVNDYDDDEETFGQNPNKIQRKHMNEDDDEDDEEDEDDEDDGNDDRGDSRKAKRRRRDIIANPFLDLQAAVDDDDGEDDEDEEAEAGFLEYHRQDDEEEDGDPERAAAHARLDRQRLHDSEISGEELARRLKERYARNEQVMEDLGTVPQRMLMPSVNDPNLWQIKVKPGREREVVLILFKKVLAMEFTSKSVKIISAFERTSLPGYVYVEARSKEAVINACATIAGVFRRDPILVPINEMAPLLLLERKEQKIQPGSWARIKRGKYQGDLCQVVDITDSGEEVGIRMIPRIDMNYREIDDGKPKRKRANTFVGRPPARLFNPEEVLRIYGKKTVLKKGNSWIFQGDTYTDGFLEKDIRVTGLTTEDVHPGLDEVSVFLSDKTGANGASGGATNLDSLAEAVRRPLTVTLQPGDHVEVFQGEQTGVQGVVDSVLGDVVLIKGSELEGQIVEVPSKSVRKKFSPGEHVRVMSGLNMDETGMVVSIEGDLVTLMSDLTETEITVFSKDLRTAAEVGSSSNVVGNYELHDLVQLDMQTVGVIYRTERDSFRVLDQFGQTRLIQPHQITMRRDTRRAISTDSEGNELRVGDNVKEVDGEQRRGVVLHIHQAVFAFLHNREIVQNGGIFVSKCRSLAPIAPKGAPKPGGMDLTKMNPAVAGGVGGAPSMSRGPRDRLINVRIKIIKGTQKGYQGVIKDVNGPHCRVELSTNNRIITIEKEKLRRIGHNGQLEPLEGPGGFVHPGQGRGGGGGSGSASWSGSSAGGRTPNPYNSDGGRTPGWGASGRTPNPYADRRTPAWSASTTTPNPYADSSKTPSWNANSRTPNPYAGGDGGRTPGWNPASRTPNPYAGGHGGKTPSWEAGSRTPNPKGASGGWGSAANDGWGTPANSTQANDSGWGRETNDKDGGWGRDTNDKDSGWGRDTHDRDNEPSWEAAPTPAASAPTPYATAPTPYASAPTPYASAPTPAVSAPTPAPYASETPATFAAPTPATYSAPTPGPGITPSLYAAPTPRGIAQTPAALADYSRPVRDAPFRTDNLQWLLEFNVQKLAARFREDDDFMGGRFANRTVMIRYVIEGKEGLGNYAHVTCTDEEGDDEIDDVPIEYLQPLYPTNASYRGRHAILLQNHMVSGRRGFEVSGAKKERVILRTFADQEWLCGRVQVPGAADIEVSAMGLCLVED